MPKKTAGRRPAEVDLAKKPNHKMLDVFDMTFLGIFGAALYFGFAKRSASGTPAGPSSANFAPEAPPIDRTVSAADSGSASMFSSGDADSSASNPLPSDHFISAVNVDGTPMLADGSSDISGNSFGVTS